MLGEIRDAALAINAFLENRVLADFGNDDLVRSAVYMKFVLIGEALTRLKVDAPDVLDSISEHWRITAFRHQIAHGYGELDDAITRRIIERKLPTLIAEVEALLAS